MKPSGVMITITPQMRFNFMNLKLLTSVVNYNDLRHITKNSYLTFKSKILHRTMIWSYTSEKIKEKYLFWKRVI